MAAKPKPFEVHEHCFISGPRSHGGYDKRGKWQTGKFGHSHEGGNVMHAHPHTGPGSYTIDKDDWYRTTGMRGGGRKKFTAKPTGEQMPIKELEESQKHFTVIIGKPTPEEWGNGPGVALPMRMALTFGMTFDVKEDE